MAWKFGNKVYRNLEEQVLKNKQDAEALTKEQKKIIVGDYSVIKPSRGAPGGYTPANAGEMEHCAAYSDNSLALGNATVAGLSLYIIENASITVERQQDGYHLFIRELDQEIVEIVYFRIVARGYEDDQIYFRGVYDYNTGILLPSGVTDQIAANIYDDDQGPIVYYEANRYDVEGDCATALGYGCYSSGYGATAEGGESIAVGERSHSEGSRNLSLGYGCHTEGVHNVVFPDAWFAHAEGGLVKVYAQRAHGEGSLTTVSGYAGHAENVNNEANGIASHAEGQNCIADGARSHVEGLGCRTTSGAAMAHAGGEDSIANNSGVFLHGRGLRDSRWYQAVFGLYNEIPTTDAGEQLIVGCGSSNAARANCFVAGNSTTLGGKYIKIGNTVLTEQDLENLIALVR